jgi:hypothetical protein
MAASKTKNGSKTVNTSTSKIYTVLITCPSFGQGIDEIDLTEGFRTPARVVEVVEGSVEDTDKMLERLGEEGGLTFLLGEGTVTGNGESKLEKGAPRSSDMEDAADDVMTLGDIYPDDDDNDNVEADMDFMSALDKLDEEDDLSELSDLAEDGLPEL